MADSLHDLYGAFVAFDALAASDEAISQGAAKMECTKPGYWVGDTEWFDDGAEWENSRRSAVDLAVGKLIEASADIGHDRECLANFGSESRGDRGRCDCGYDAVSEALAQIRLALEGE